MHRGLTQNARHGDYLDSEFLEPLSGIQIMISCSLSLREPIELNADRFKLSEGQRKKPNEINKLSRRDCLGSLSPSFIAMFSIPFTFILYVKLQ